MKKVFALFGLLFFIGGLAGCKKSSTSIPVNTAKCKPLTKFTNFNATNSTYTYSYSADGNLASLLSSPSTTAIGSSSTSITRPASVRVGLTDSLNTYYDANIFTSLPTVARQSITLDGITQVDHWLFKFSYDAKSRLVEVIENTPHVTGDDEYMLTISYNDQDNVTSLKYESFTGPRTATVISATGYDDKPGPYSSIKNWPLFMFTPWNNSDPGPLFEALSKNNPLGYSYPSIGFTRTMAYTYNENGFPLKRVNTNTNNSGSYSYDEIYTYQCK